MRRSAFQTVLGLGLLMLGFTLLGLMLGSRSSLSVPLPPAPPIAPIAPIPPLAPIAPIPPIAPIAPLPLELQPESGWTLWLNLGLLTATAVLILIWRRPLAQPTRL